jgi:uncharacterized protein with von Willebrand factor type A (vWA) domain
LKTVGKFFKKRRIDEDLNSSPFSIDCDSYDIGAFEEIRNHNPVLNENMTKGAEDYEPFSDLLQDSFSSLYKYHPEILPEYEIKHENLLNREIMSKVMESPKYKELRALTRMDSVNASIGTEILSSQLKDLIKKSEAQRKSLKEMSKAAQKVEELEKGGTGEDGKDGKDGKDSKNNSSGIAGAPQTLALDKAKERLEKFKKEFKDSTEEKKFKQGIIKSISVAQKGVEEVGDMVYSWGLSEDDSYTKTSYRDKMELLNRLRDSKLMEIAKLVGKYRALAMQRMRQKVVKGNSETYSIEQGNNIPNLLPMELMLLSEDEAGEDMFLSKFSERKLLQYAKRAKEKEVKGPIMVAMDESGSMSGDPETWAKAVALGLLEVAQNSKRDFGAIHFSGKSDPKKLKVDYFYKSESKNIAKLIEFAEYFIGGGTDFETPLSRAKMTIDEHEKFTKADIVFISDGSCAISNSFKKEFNRWRKEKKVSIYSVLIDKSYSSLASFKEFTDPSNIFRLSDLVDKNKDEVATIVFDMIV